MSDNEIFNPEETISIQASSVANSKDNVFRLCEYDTESQIGCRRTNTILALEAEYDTFVDPEMFWGIWDQFCIHEGKTYYYKGWLQENVSRDLASVESNEIQVEISKINEYLGYNLGYDNLTFDILKSHFTNKIPGLPTLILETPQFLQCEDVGTDKITIDNLDRDKLNLIESTFTNDIHPLMANIANSLHLKDGKVFCTDVLAYENNPAGKLGVLMIPTETEKYEANKPYFFPFQSLTAQQEEVVKAMANVESEFAGTVTIINL